MGNPRTSHGGFSLQSHGNVYMGIFLIDGGFDMFVGKINENHQLNGVFFQQSMFNGG